MSDGVEEPREKETAAIMRMPYSSPALCSAIISLLLSIPSSTACAQSPVVDLAAVRDKFENRFTLHQVAAASFGQFKMRAADAGPSYYASIDVALSQTIMGVDLTSAYSDQQRAEWISHLHTYARPDGTYSDTFGHSQLHANGQTIGALGVLGGKQLFPATPLYAPFNEPAEAQTYLANSINWTSQWGESHKFWGGLDMYSHSSVATPEWKSAVFDWLDANIDPTTGWWRLGQQPSSNLQGLGGGAHIWPIYEQSGREFPEPERVIDRILSMQVASGRFGGNNSGYMDLDALYGLRYMRSISPDYRTAEIDQAVKKFGQWIAGDVDAFLAGNPTMHETLSKVGAFGLLNQLAPTLFPDSTGAAWSDIFTDQRFYQTAAVETFAISAPPIGGDLPSAYSQTVLAAQPVGYWRMGETGGVSAANSTSQADLNGYFVGLGEGSGPGNLAQSGPRPPAGYRGMSADNRAVHLNGQQSYVAVPDGAPLDVIGALSLEAWIKLDAIPTGNAGIVAKYAGSGSQRSFQIYVNGQGAGNGELGMIISPDGTFTNAKSLIDNVPLPTGEWLHVVGVFDPSIAMRLYVNGQLVEQSTSGIPAHMFASSADLWIGKQFDSSSANHFSGMIDEAAVYDRALTAQEVIAHYEVALALAGDFNGDQFVDGADLLAWQRAFGSNGAHPADADRNHVVDEGDLAIWRNYYGASGLVDQLAAVPEPAGLALVCLSILAIAPRRRCAPAPASPCRLLLPFASKRSIQ